MVDDGLVWEIKFLKYESRRQWQGLLRLFIFAANVDMMHRCAQRSTTINQLLKQTLQLPTKLSIFTTRQFCGRLIIFKELSST